MQNEAGIDAKVPTQELLLKADELDTGTTIQSPGTTRPLSALTTTNLDTEARPKPPPRPGLKREGSTTTTPPPPPSQPPPAPPPQSEDPTDSLSLPQLRQLVRQFPRAEPQAFAYHYEDAQDFGVEIDEWFSYSRSDADRDQLLAAREAFEELWQDFSEQSLQRNDVTWLEVNDADRKQFLVKLKPRITATDTLMRLKAVSSLLYVLSGVWTVTAGVDSTNDEEDKKTKLTGNPLQIKWIHRNVDTAINAGVLKPLYQVLRTTLETPVEEGFMRPDGDDDQGGLFNDDQYFEISVAFSCLYLIIESARWRQSLEEAQIVRQELMSLQPHGILVFFTWTISQLRWDVNYNIPLTHAVQIVWKSLLLIFGDTKDHLEKIKGILQPRVDPFSADASKPVLTASPLDYHLFRQEITSKYPAYNPPPPLIPLEIDQRNILPPLPHHAARTENFDTFQRSGPSGSIMHQPVHIATPAPSPPPSPGGPGGKGGKKQNYQTNQNFPFLYPPLDGDSNNIGGKGSTQHQDSTVGRRWEGSDVPASILEASELFASRMRMTRAMRQLWKERDMFMKYDRGWDSADGKSTKTNEDAQTQGLQDKLEDLDLQQRMDAVEVYFHHSLPDFQSFVIVLMKIMLTNVQAIAIRNTQLQEQGLTGALNRSKSNSNLAGGANVLPNPPSPQRTEDLSIEDLDNIRASEISQKSLTATIFLMLKWFKVSHILKSEYITQLLLDSTYIQLTLKYFAHQHLEELVTFRYDREDLSFWQYCQIHSDHPPLSPTSPAHHSETQEDAGSEDEAMPPPIARNRDPIPPTPTTPATPVDPVMYDNVEKPLVDELGNPITEFPNQPLSSFSTRHFHTSINMLRVLQKITRAKPHRVLLLVSYKSAQIFRRILRVPEPLLRLYVLKLFKSQVPYCGRKWRQSNMRVITAIYLHCRPELRDEWLAGLHDAAPGAGMGGPGTESAEYEEAVPLEWGLRGLTFWWMKRMYPDVMRMKGKNRKTGAKLEDPKSRSEEAERSGADIGDDDAEDDEYSGGQEIEPSERDFFRRELDAVGWGLAELQFRGDDEVGFGEEAPGANMQDQNHSNGYTSRDAQNHAQTWAAESPNSEYGQTAGYMPGGHNLAAWS